MFTRWFEIEPTYSALDDMRARMEQLFEQLLENGDVSATDPRTTRTWPRATLFDTGENLVLKAEVPGLDETNIQLQAAHDVLSVSGERKATVPEGYSVHRQERPGIRFSRSFTFPIKVDPDRVTAEVRDGMLTVTLPKAPEVKPRAISVLSR